MNISPYLILVTQSKLSLLSFQYSWLDVMHVAFHLLSRFLFLLKRTESSPEEKDMGVLVEEKLNIR